MARMYRHALPLFALGVASTGGASADDALARYRWQARVLVVAGPSADDARFLEQKRLYAQARRGMSERDLVLVEAVGRGAEAASLRRRLRIGEGEFAAILVGKDGGPKLRSAAPISADQLFDTVDAMPMRRDEMRRRPAG